MIVAGVNELMQRGGSVLDQITNVEVIYDPPSGNGVEGAVIRVVREYRVGKQDADRILDMSREL
ncbi:hypothetical protein DEI86_07780 [Curtobacterium sp. MCBD17_028]|nr:hypothetical protein DEI86_07780 [Curtobacterium sp. MCBD17_028]